MHLYKHVNMPTHAPIQAWAASKGEWLFAAGVRSARGPGLLKQPGGQQPDGSSDLPPAPTGALHWSESACHSIDHARPVVVSSPGPQQTMPQRPTASGPLLTSNSDSALLKASSTSLVAACCWGSTSAVYCCFTLCQGGRWMDWLRAWPAWGGRAGVAQMSSRARCK